MPFLLRLIILFALLSLPIGVAAKNNIHHVDFHNFSYPFKDEDFSRCLGRVVKVRDGKFDEPHISTNVAYCYFHVAEILYGDLTGDGQDEAAVVVIYGSDSGTFYRTNIYVFTLRINKPVLLGALTEEEANHIYKRYYHEEGNYLYEALEGGRRIKSRILISRHLADGGHCCQENVVTFEYKWDGSRMIFTKLLKRRVTATDERMKAYFNR